MALLSANLLVIPFPDILSNWLSNGAENPQALQVTSDVVVTGPLEQPQSRWRDVELGDLVLLNDLPVPGEVWVCGSTLKHQRSHT